MHELDEQSSNSVRVMPLSGLLLSGLLLSGPLLLAPVTTQALSLSDVFKQSGATDATGIDVKANANKPLPVEQAFQVVAEQLGNQVKVTIAVKDGYYVYRDKLKLLLPDGVTASALSFNQTPNYVDDPDFGRVAVFDKDVVAVAMLTSQKSISNQSATVKWQGCAKAGLCYPPQTVGFTLGQLSALPTSKKASTQALGIASAEMGSTTPVASPISKSISQPISQPVSKPFAEPTANAHALTASANQSTNPPVSTPPVSTPQATPYQTSRPQAELKQADSNGDIFGLTTHTGLALLLLFLAGLGLAFTPCVLPMLPIVANIVARQHRPSAKKGLLLTGGYGLGVATSYGLIGALVAVFGQSLGLMAMLQNPAVLLSFATLFVLLGLYLLDRLPIRLPARVSHRLQRLAQVGENRLGSITGSFISGFFSALVVSPCVSAPLAGAMAGVAMTGNPWLGFLALFLMGLGLSTPLILLGMTQGNLMPKAGEWMQWVKTAFALLMFAVALLLIERVWLSSGMLVLWAVWFAVVGVWLWQWAGQGRLLSRALALVVSAWAACLMLGVALGSQDSWQPLQPLTHVTRDNLNNSAKTQPTDTLRITSLNALTPILQQHPNVLVDVTASWCIECRINDKNLFANPPTTLSAWQLVKLDVTDNTPDAKAVYQQLHVFGPPVLLYYQQGRLVARQNGQIKRADFEQQLSKLPIHR